MLGKIKYQCLHSRLGAIITIMGWSYGVKLALQNTILGLYYSYISSKCN